MDAETGFYYYGARYLDPKTSRWISADPALGEYIPGAPINDDVRKQNENLPNGGVYNYINLHAFHYSNNNPVKYTDPDGRFPAMDTAKKVAGQVIADTKVVVGIANDVLGKINALPMTGVGLIVGGVLTGISKISGKDGSIEPANNAITFTTGLDLGGSITLGNTIIHAGGDFDRWNKNKETFSYDLAKINLGKHEEAHTKQYQTYGILTIPVILGSAIANGGLKENGFKDFMNHSKLEREADDLSKIP
jgi:RHS repeat-associated protein